MKKGLAPGLLLPLMLFTAVFGVAILHVIGVIDVTGFLNPSTDKFLNTQRVLNPNVDNTNGLPEGTVNEPYPTYDFSNELIPLLPATSQGAPYSFYLGSGVGFPPMGMTLGIDGILRGTPTGKGGTFQVCVKDVGGKSTCRTYSIAVNPAKTPVTPKTIDLNGLWGNNRNNGITKITQTGNTVTFTNYKLDPSWAWQGTVGETTVQATLNGNKLTGKIKIVPKKEHCPGYSWWHNYEGIVSEDGKTIDETFQTNVYYIETCQESGSYPEKTSTMMKVE